jgi:hypothetical protein
MAQLRRSRPWKFRRTRPTDTIGPLITLLGGTSVDSAMTVVPTPNTSAYAESNVTASITT